VKIHPVEAKMFHEDMTKLTVASFNFAIAPKNHRILGGLLYRLLLSYHARPTNETTINGCGPLPQEGWTPMLHIAIRQCDSVVSFTELETAVWINLLWLL
jgi:hypothetical protein